MVRQVFLSPMVIAPVSSLLADDLFPDPVEGVRQSVVFRIVDQPVAIEIDLSHQGIGASAAHSTEAKLSSALRRIETKQEHHARIFRPQSEADFIL